MEDIGGEGGKVVVKDRRKAWKKFKVRTTTMGFYCKRGYEPSDSSR